MRECHARILSVAAGLMMVVSLHAEVTAWTESLLRR